MNKIRFIQFWCQQTLFSIPPILSYIHATMYPKSNIKDEERCWVAPKLQTIVNSRKQQFGSLWWPLLMRWLIRTFWKKNTHVSRAALTLDSQYSLWMLSTTQHQWHLQAQYEQKGQGIIVPSHNWMHQLECFLHLQGIFWK